MASFEADRLNTGTRGRPTVVITPEQLKSFQELGYTVPDMAKALKCSDKTVYKNLYQYGMKQRDKYSNISDVELEGKVRELSNEFPNSGNKMLQGYLKAGGMTVQRHRLRRAIQDTTNAGGRMGNPIMRRTYKVNGPNSLWHIDAHLKLVRWGFAIHGAIDGYSRLVVYLQSAISMGPEVVVNLFTAASEQYGLPSRVRSDHGYENIHVALLMNLLRGLDRGSHITGRSVNNQRIERLWRDVYKDVVSTFNLEFTQLEEEFHLSPDNKIHRYAIQQVYLPEINAKLEFWRHGWNKHGLRSAGHKSPEQLWHDGLLAICNGNSTTAREIFVDPTISIEERIVNRLVEEGGVVDDGTNRPTPPSRLRADVVISREQETELMDEIVNVSNRKEKCLVCIQKLLTFNLQ